MTRFLLAETDYNGDAGDYKLVKDNYRDMPKNAQRVNIMHKETYSFSMAYETKRVFKSGFVPSPEMPPDEIEANIQSVRILMPFDKGRTGSFEHLIKGAYHHTITPYENAGRWEVAVYFKEHAYILDIESLDEFLPLEGTAQKLRTDEFEFLDAEAPKYVLVLP